MKSIKAIDYVPPFWWMAVIEVLLTVLVIFFIFDHQYLEAILVGIFIELREITWRMKLYKSKG